MQELIEAGDDWADNLREVLRGRDLEFCRVLTAGDKPLTVLPSADSADLIDAPLPEDFPLQVWLKARFVLRECLDVSQTDQFSDPRAVYGQAWVAGAREFHGLTPGLQGPEYQCQGK